MKRVGANAGAAAIAIKLRRVSMSTLPLSRWSHSNLSLKDCNSRRKVAPGDHTVGAHHGMYVE